MNTTPEERQQMANLTLRTILGMFPIVGPILKDILFEYRSRVQQDRINHFVGRLEGSFTNYGINIGNLENEETLDLLENIFKKALQTRSEQKREYLKNILMQGLKDKAEIDYCEVFAELIVSIHHKQIEILTVHQNYLINGKSALVTRRELKTKYDRTQHLIEVGIPESSAAVLSKYMLPHKTQKDLDAEIDTASKLIETYKKECTAHGFELDEDKYKYFIQDLLSKGLLSDDGVGSIGTVPLEIMSLTKFGNKFLKFVRL